MIIAVSDYPCAVGATGRRPAVATVARAGLGAARVLATATLLRQLARGRHRRPPLTGLDPVAGSVTVVIPARDEEGRISQCLQGILSDPQVGELLVIDDHSSDATAALSRALGARVLYAPPLPDGWDGKSWALQHGLQAAGGDIVVSLDADTIPRPGLIGALCAALDDADFVSAGARFRCETAGERFLHPAMLITLIARFGPPDSAGPIPDGRRLVSGQCTAVRRSALLDAGGYEAAAGHMADDVALARDLARRGWRVHFHQAGELLLVDMHDSVAETWREWGRTIALADVTPPVPRGLDLIMVWLVLALPILRALSGRVNRLDAAALLLRAGLLGATAPSYERRGLPFWLSPLADPLAAVVLTRSALWPTRRWRGRDYDASADAALTS